MNNELEQRLARLENTIGQLQVQMRGQETLLRRNHELLVEFMDVMTKPEAEGETLEALLTQLIGRLNRLGDLSEKSLAAIDQLSDRLP
jgi:hypothetical protein